MPVTFGLLLNLASASNAHDTRGAVGLSSRAACRA